MQRAHRIRALAIAYVLVVAFVFSLLVDRRPAVTDMEATVVPVFGIDPIERIPAAERLLTRGAALGAGNLLHPSPEAAWLLLERAIPLLWAVDPGAGRQLDVYAAPPARPGGLLESLFPFMAGAGSRWLSGPASEPPPVSGPGPSPPPAAVPEPPPAGSDPRTAAPDQPAAPDGTPPGAPSGDGRRGSLSPRAGLPLVGVYHTHEYESYISEFPGKTFPTRESLKNVATPDPERSVVRVGRQLALSLYRRGVGVVHSPSPNSGDNYLGAYLVSLRTARYILDQYPSVKILLDVHRDDAPRAESTATVGGASVARVAIVIGRGDDDLPQPSWQANMEFAQQLGDAMERRYPGVFRGIITRPARYNQHLLPGSVLFEIGSATNTMPEALRAAEMVAEVLADLIDVGRFPQP